MTKSSLSSFLLLIGVLGFPMTARAQASATHDPTWWDKYQFIS